MNFNCIDTLAKVLNAGSIPATSTNLITITMTRYELEQRYLEADFVYNMLTKYGIQEITTQRQAKNDTRAFKMPTGQILATYKSGMVRRCDSSDRVYQLNPKYKTKTRWVFLTENGLETKEYHTWARAIIYSRLARLNFILKYYLKNYKTNTK